MIRETYKGRQLKAVKGKSYANSRITVNGTDCGEWFGTQADVIEWAKRTIDDVDSRPFEGRWNECWYAPGTYEVNEIGHATAPGGVCSCDLCKTEPWNSCQNITAGGVCVCTHCMKPRITNADVAEGVDASVELPGEVVPADTLSVGDVISASTFDVSRRAEILRQSESYEHSLLGLGFRYWARDVASDREGWMEYGAGGVVRRLQSA